MNRLSFVFTTTLLAACTESVPAPAPPASEALPVRGALATEGERLTRCVTPGFARYTSSSYTMFRDVAIRSDGAVLISGSDWDRGIAFSYRSTLEPVATLETGGYDSFDALAVDRSTDRAWLAARTNGIVPGFPGRGSFDVLAGELVESGFVPMARGFQTTPEYIEQAAVSAGLIAIAGYDWHVDAGGAPTTDPFVAVFAANDQMTPKWSVRRLHPDNERYTAVGISSKAILMGGNISDGQAPGMFVVARDHDAGSYWTQRLSTNGADDLAAVAALPSGDVLWAGTVSTEHAGTHIVLGKLAGATGTPLWTQTLGAGSDERAADLAVTSDGRIVILAEVAGDGRDAALIVTDDSGALQSEEIWSSPGDDHPTALALDACDDAAMVGHADGDGFVRTTAVD